MARKLATNPDKSLERLYAEFIEGLLFRPGDGYIQIRKFFTCLTWQVPWSAFKRGFDIEFSMLGYGNDVAKMKQLERHYYNEAELDAANQKLLERMGSGNNRENQSCITARMGAATKDSRSQGYCLQTVTASHLKDSKKSPLFFGIDVNYRTTELTQKFIADLRFLSEIVVPRMLNGLDIEPTHVRFTFSQAYISAMFMPITFLYIPPDVVLDGMIEGDPKWYRLIRKAVEKFMQEGTGYNYRTRANMHGFFRREVFPLLSRSQIERINEHLEEA